MNLKVALLLLLVFAVTVATTAVAFSISAPATLSSKGNTAATGNSMVKPLGDPIDSPGHPG